MYDVTYESGIIEDHSPSRLPVAWRANPRGPTVLHYGDLADALEYRWNRNNSGTRLECIRMSQSFNATDNDQWYLKEENAEADKLRLIPPPDFRAQLPRLLELVDKGMQISVTARVESQNIQAVLVWI
ncbi:hypothetical protein C8R47DRAFT_1079169 [Mycena vitilis]|nr:hypothetical protein C8R47DRAFT_1079169 [Mycena vitilis]